MYQNRPKSIPERFPSLVWWFANQCWHLWSISEPKSALGSPNELRTRFWADMAPKVSRMLICWNPWISTTCQDISVTQMTLVTISFLQPRGRDPPRNSIRSALIDAPNSILPLRNQFSESKIPTQDSSKVNQIPVFFVRDSIRATINGMLTPY